MIDRINKATAVAGAALNGVVQILGVLHARGLLNPEDYAMIGDAITSSLDSPDVRDEPEIAAARTAIEDMTATGRANNRP